LGGIREDSLETIALIFTAISCTAGATWVLRTSISKVAQALAVHAEEDKTYHAKIIQLEAKQKARRR
jgi:hypothetical protein